MSERDRLFKELCDIRDAYKVDVMQYVAFMKERELRLVEGFKEYAVWLEQEHDGRRYSPATFNRKIAAAKNRIRYAFKHSSAAGSLRKKYQLEEVLKAVKPKRIASHAIAADKVLSSYEVKKLSRETKDETIRLMVEFLVDTGVRVSEMLSIRLSDLLQADGDFSTVRIVGKGRKERSVHVKTKLVDRIFGHFHGKTYLFEHHEKPFSRISVTNRIKHESLKTIGREVTAQQLRHTWAVIQIQRGKPVSAVAVALGHSDPGLTAKMYADTKLEPEEAFIDIPDSDQHPS